MRRTAATVLALALASATVQTGCVFVGGYSSERGWFIWPGTFVFLAIAILLFFLLRRRRT